MFTIATFLLKHSGTILTTILEIRNKALGMGKAAKSTEKLSKVSKVSKGISTPMQTSSAISLVITLLPFIPTTFYTSCIEFVAKLTGSVVYRIGRIVINMVIKILKMFTWISYLFLSFCVGISFYVFNSENWIITIPALTAALQGYFPELSVDTCHTVNVVVTAFISILILLFFYFILAHKKVTVKYEYIPGVVSNGIKKEFGTLLSSKLPEENTVIGKSLLGMFYLGCSLSFIYIGIFLRHTLPEIFNLYGKVQTPVITLTRSCTTDEKIAWLNELKIALVDWKVPVNQITAILEQLLSNLDTFKTQQELLFAAQTICNQRYAELLADYKFSFWADVVIKHPLFFAGLTIAFVTSIAILGWMNADFIANQRAIQKNIIDCQTDIYKLLSEKINFLVAVINAHQEAMRQNKNLSFEIIDAFNVTLASLKGTINGPVWVEIQKKMDDIAAAAKGSNAAAKLAHSATYAVDQFKQLLADYPNMQLRAVNAHLVYDTVLSQPTRLQAAVDFLGNILTMPARQLRNFSYNATITSYMEKAGLANAKKSGFLHWLHDHLF